MSTSLNAHAIFNSYPDHVQDSLNKKGYTIGYNRHDQSENPAELCTQKSMIILSPGPKGLGEDGSLLPQRRAEIIQALDRLVSEITGYVLPERPGAKVGVSKAEANPV